MFLLHCGLNGHFMSLNRHHLSLKCHFEKLN
jgi:hypothetical protein